MKAITAAIIFLAILLVAGEENKGSTSTAAAAAAIASANHNQPPPELNYAECLENCYKFYCVSNVTGIQSYCADWGLQHYCQGKVESNYETPRCIEKRYQDSVAKGIFTFAIIATLFVFFIALVATALHRALKNWSSTEKVDPPTDDLEKGVRPDPN